MVWKEGFPTRGIGLGRLHTERGYYARSLVDATRGTRIRHGVY